MIQILRDNPLVLLFVVAAVGYPLGRVSVGGVRLGIAAVLFVGLAAGALHPDLRLPEIIYLLGLVLFIYTTGLSNGPGFVASFRRGGEGLRDSLLALGVLLVATAVVAAATAALGLSPPLAAGLFAGSLTNTPALAGVLEHLQSTGQSLSDPVVGYSLTYPVGVAGMVAALYAAQRIWRVDYQAEAAAQPGAAPAHLATRTIRVTRQAVAISVLAADPRWDVVFGRVKHDGHLVVARGDTRLGPGDLVRVVGSPGDVDRVEAHLGERSDEPIELDRSELDYRRVFVSSADVAGRQLGDLNLPQRLGAIVTRVRRGDVDLLAHADMVLELGDRVRVLTSRENMARVTAFFGDSYRALAEIDVMTFGLGLAIGLLLGVVPIPLPGGIVVRLGLAGGPLVVGLVAGAVARTGPLVWNIPYAANLTLRQIGLVLFLAGIGTRAGYTFGQTIARGNGLIVFAAGAAVTMLAAVAMLWIGRRFLRLPMGLLAGMLAGVQTQPAVLGFATEQAGNDLPNAGYARVYPVATIAKVVLAQVLLLLWR